MDPLLVRPSTPDEEESSSDSDATNPSGRRPGAPPARSFLSRFLTNAVGLTPDAQGRTQSSPSSQSRILPSVSPQTLNRNLSVDAINDDNGTNRYTSSREVVIRRNSLPDETIREGETELMGSSFVEDVGESRRDLLGALEHNGSGGHSGDGRRGREDEHDGTSWSSSGRANDRPRSDLVDRLVDRNLDAIEWEPSNPETRVLTREQENRAIVADNLARETTNLVERGQIDLERSQLYSRRGLMAVGLVVSIFSCLGAMVYLYAQGWWALIWHGGEPCDVELAPWLCFYLIFLPIDFFLSSRIRPLAYRLCCNWSPAFSAEDPPTRIRFLQFLYIVFIVEVYSLGFSLLSHSKTCKETAPELYKWVQHWLSFGLFLWFLFYSFAACGLVIFQSLIAGGLWKTDDAADPQVVHKMESMTYYPNENWDGEEGRPPRECCICMELYATEDEIRRTPCKHVFHGDCLRNWLKTQRTCPLCRIDLQEALEAGEVDV